MDFYTKFTLLELKEFIQKPILAGTYDNEEDQNIADTGTLLFSNKMKLNVKHGKSPAYFEAKFLANEDGLIIASGYYNEITGYYNDYFGEHLVLLAANGDRIHVTHDYVEHSG